MNRLAIAIVAPALIAGCMSSKSPYDYAENWLMREGAVRTFTVGSDLIYIQDRLYLSMNDIPSMNSYAMSEVGNGRFRGIARVFSPLVSCEEDLEKALDWYFRHQHGGRRLFSFIGEGRGGALLKAYEEKNAEALKKKGLLVSYYSDEARSGFVTDAMAREIKNAVSRARYRAQWGREMPDGMLKD